MRSPIGLVFLVPLLAGCINGNRPADTESAIQPSFATVGDAGIYSFQGKGWHRLVVSPPNETILDVRVRIGGKDIGELPRNGSLDYAIVLAFRRGSSPSSAGVGDAFAWRHWDTPAHPAPEVVGNSVAVEAGGELIVVVASTLPGIEVQIAPANAPQLKRSTLTLGPHPGLKMNSPKPVSTSALNGDLARIEYQRDWKIAEKIGDRGEVIARWWVEYPPGSTVAGRRYDRVEYGFSAPGASTWEGPVLPPPWRQDWEASGAWSGEAREGAELVLRRVIRETTFGNPPEREGIAALVIPLSEAKR